MRRNSIPLASIYAELAAAVKFYKCSFMSIVLLSNSFIKLLPSSSLHRILSTTLFNMRLGIFSVLLAPLLLASFTAGQIDTTASKDLNIEYLLTVNTKVGKPLKPIPIRGGSLVVLPIVGGKVTGPALNGTLISGIVRASYFENQTIEYPMNSAYGLSDDGETFVIEQVGKGLAGRQAASLVSTHQLPPRAVHSSLSFKDSGLTWKHKTENSHRRKILRSRRHFHLDAKCRPPWGIGSECWSIQGRLAVFIRGGLLEGNRKQLAIMLDIFDSTKRAPCILPPTQFLVTFFIVST